MHEKVLTVFGFGIKFVFFSKTDWDNKTFYDFLHPDDVNKITKQLVPFSNSKSIIDSRSGIPQEIGRAHV